MDKIENEKAAGGVETIAAAGDVQRGHSTIQATHSGNSASAQWARLLAHLKTAPLDTIYARKRLDILMPAARQHHAAAKHSCAILDAVSLLPCFD